MAVSDFFISVVLADAHLAAGDIEQACNVTLDALGAGEHIRSARCVGYLRKFMGHLPATGNRALVDFREQVAGPRLRRQGRGCGG